MVEKTNIFLDKKILSFMVLDKEGQLIGSMNKLQIQLVSGYISEKDISKQEQFIDAWRLIAELFDYLEFNKMNKLKDKLPDQLKILQECVAAWRISGKVIDPRINKENLLRCYNAIRQMISESGYHDDTMQSLDIDDEPQFF